jgi:hypothetical protein
MNTQNKLEEYNNKFVELVNEESIKECIEYLPEKEQDESIFRETLKGLSVKIQWSEDQTYKDDKNRNGYIVKVSREGKKTIKFNYWTSQVDTWEHKKPNLYDILTCIALDGTIDDPADMGIDPIEEKKLYNAVIKQREKILKVFDQMELYSFPS